MEKENKDIQQSSAATMRVEGMYDPTVETYIWDDLSLICKVEKVLVVNTGDKIDLKYACVNELGQRNVMTPGSEEDIEVNLTLDRCITEDALRGALCDYDDESEAMYCIFEGLRRWEAKGVKLDNGTIVSFDEYYKDTTRSHSHDEKEIEGEDDLYVDTCESMVGRMVSSFDSYDSRLVITEAEAEMLAEEAEVSFSVDGPYFASKKTLVYAHTRLTDDNKYLHFGTPLRELRFALREQWKKNDYGHNFEDFVIEKFDMKVTRGKVTILIELGS